MFTDTHEGIQAYNDSVLSQSDAQKNAVHKVFAPLRSVEISLSKQDCKYGETIEVSVIIEHAQSTIKGKQTSQILASNTNIQATTSSLDLYYNNS